jgi:hypothetical protein
MKLADKNAGTTKGRYHFEKKNYNIKMIPCQNFRKIKVKILFASMGENEVQFF